jgi:hypothetical protein
MPTNLTPTNRMDLARDVKLNLRDELRTTGCIAHCKLVNSVVCGSVRCDPITAITTVLFSRAAILRTLYSSFSFAPWPNLFVEGEHLMRNSGADWLSCTIRTVEQIMERHGFQEDEPNTEAPAKTIGHEPLSRWERLLRAARPILLRSK